MKKLIIVVVALFFMMFLIIVSFFTVNYENMDGEGVDSEYEVDFVVPTGEKYIFPVQSTFLYSSSYGWRWGAMHFGMDAASNAAPSILSFSDGTVSQKGYDSSRGNYIYIYHNIDGVLYTTAYYHLHSSSSLAVGDNVLIGDVIGKMGNTGESTGIHLHFEISIGHNISYSAHVANSIDPNILFQYVLGNVYN